MIWVPWRVSGLPNNAMSPSGGQMRLSTPRSTLDHNIVLSRGTLVSLLPLLPRFNLISDQKIENTSETRIFLFLTKNKKYHWHHNILISDQKLGNTIETRIFLSWKKTRKYHWNQNIPILISDQPSPQPPSLCLINHPRHQRPSSNMVKT